MGLIREPKGVDFVVKSEPLTDKERDEISKHIAEYKAKSKKKSGAKGKRKKTVVPA